MKLLQPTPASRWRLALASILAGQYARHAHVAGALAGGSTARGQADRFSDLELMVLWSTAPTDQERREVIDDAGGDCHALYPYDDAYELWEDAFFMGRDQAGHAKSGCLVEVSHYLVPTVIGRIDQVIVQSHADEDLLNLMAGLVDGHILLGESLIGPWKDQVSTYPDALQHAVIQRYGYIDHFWRWEMYLVPPHLSVKEEGR